MLPQAIGLFGPHAAHFWKLIEAVKPGLDGQTYTFMDNERFQREIAPRGLKWMNQVYWREMFARAHLATATSLLRNERWFRGAINNAEDKNFYGFAACFRGLLEASADSFSCLRKIPGTIARDAKQLCQALDGELDVVAVNPDLENELVHYSHARRKERHLRYITLAPPVNT
jgi:hypothetical protein